MPVHKLYIDSRAKIGTSSSHSNFTWQAPNPIQVEDSRAYIDSVHLPVTWGTIHSNNQHLFVSEQLDSWTVTATQNKVYLYETYGTTESIRIATISAAAYATGAALAAALQTALDAGSIIPGAYSVVHSGSGQGTLTITHAAAASPFSLSIGNRLDLASLGVWGGTSITPTDLQDAGDVLGLLDGSAPSVLPNNGSLVLTCGYPQAYRKLVLPSGIYDATTLPVAITNVLNAGTTMATYTASVSTLTNNVTISTNSSKHFWIWPSEYLDLRPYSFQGHTNGHHCYDIIGINGGKKEGSSSSPVVGESHINVMAHHTVFINSNLGMHSDSVGPLGQSSIARKVVIDQPAGGLVNDYHSSPFDYVEVPAGDIHQISFKLTDWRGQEIDMQVGWSLSIILVPEREF